MGEAGDAAEAVDERVWDEEDRQEQQGRQVGGRSGWVVGEVGGVGGRVVWVGGSCVAGVAAGWVGISFVARSLLAGPCSSNAG